MYELVLNKDGTQAYWARKSVASDSSHQSKLIEDKMTYNEKVELAKDPNTPKEVLKNLSKDEDLDIRESVAKNPNTPIDILTTLSKDKNWYVRKCVALNSNTPIDILTTLSKDTDFDVRFGVAGNPNTPINILQELSKDKNWYVRMFVAGNPSTPNEILQELSKNEDWVIRTHVAKNPNTPKETLITLSKDNDWGVRYGVAANPNTPKEALITLSKDKFEDVNKIALKRLEELNSPKNKIESTESKISNNKTTLNELFKEKQIDPNSKVGLELLKVYNDTQDKLKIELEELKTQVVDIATNDFNSL